MVEVRRAGAADAAELVRLRGVMFEQAEGSPEDAEWGRLAIETLRARLPEANPTLVAFVVDMANRPGILAACAVGAVDHRLGGPGNATGKAGYIFNVVTDPDQRRRGYSRACE